MPIFESISDEIGKLNLFKQPPLPASPQNAAAPPPARRDQLSRNMVNLVNTGTTDGGGAGEDIVKTALNKNFGREYVNALYPYDVEVYALALELVDSDNTQTDFFSFPILPRSISQAETFNNSIESTAAGVISVSNPTFVPITISLSGTFGRGFKYFQYRGQPDGGRNPFIRPTSSNNGTANTVESTTANVLFDTTGTYATGYTNYKVLEYMVRKACALDNNGNPYKLFMYNLSLGSNYLVEPVQLTPSQNRDSSNLMWDYALVLKAIAPAEAVKNNLDKALTAVMNWSARDRQLIQLSSTAEQATKNINNEYKSRVEQLLLRQAKARTLNLFTNNTQAAIIAATQLYESQYMTNVFTQVNRQIVPREFAYNNFESILNRF